MAAVEGNPRHHGEEPQEIVPVGPFLLFKAVNGIPQEAVLLLAYPHPVDSALRVLIAAVDSPAWGLPHKAAGNGHPKALAAKAVQLPELPIQSDGGVVIGGAVKEVQKPGKPCSRLAGDDVNIPHEEPLPSCNFFST